MDSINPTANYGIFQKQGKCKRNTLLPLEAEKGHPFRNALNNSVLCIVHCYVFFSTASFIFDQREGYVFLVLSFILGLPPSRII